MRWTWLPNKLYYSTVVEAADYLWETFSFPITRGKIFLCMSTTLRWRLEQGIPIQMFRAMYLREGSTPPRRTASPESTQGRPDLLSASRRNAAIRSKQGFQDTWVGLPHGEIQWLKSTVLISVTFWSTERRKENGRLEHDSSLYQASHVNHC